MRRGETSNDLDWRLGTEACLFKLHNDHSQSKRLLKEEAGPDYGIEFTASSG